MSLTLFFSILAGAGILAVFSLARMSGWREIAAQYASASFPSTNCHRWITGRLGIVLYRNLVFVATEQGLYVRTVRWTSVFHTPLFIPWDEISIDSGQSLLTPTVRLTFRRVPRRSLGLLAGDFNRLNCGGQSDGRVCP